MKDYRTLEKLTEGLPGGDPLGLRVEVTVDRPLGSRHPRFPETVYPVNYGFVAGVLGGDGEAQDVYILGVDRPVERFRGRVIAVIRRAEDREEKWVAAPEGAVFFEPEIRAAVDFTERYFRSSYRCLFEKACGAVLFSEDGGERRYLLVQGHNGRVGFSKGHIEGTRGRNHRPPGGLGGDGAGSGAGSRVPAGVLLPAAHGGSQGGGVFPGAVFGDGGFSVRGDRRGDAPSL